MASILSGNQVKLNNGKTIAGKNGEWYDSQQYWDGTLSSPGQINSKSNQQGAGQQVSNAVIAQTNPNNVQFIEQQKLQANQIQPATNLNLPSSASNSGMSIAGLQAQADAARKVLDSTLATRKAEVDAKLVELRKKEQDTLAQAKEVTQPFREDLENAERERLYVNQNFEANQALVNELDTLLTQGNELIAKQQSVTGLAAVRNPRIQKTMEDINARAGVIQAVLNARNSQIAQAFTMIDRSIGAITDDRKDQLTYYETVLKLNERDILSLDEDSKTLASQQISLLKDDLDRANATVDYVKKLLIDPATAQLLGEAGVSLNDSVDTINQKVSRASAAREVREQSNQITAAGGQAVLDPTGIPETQLRSFVDSQGTTHYFKMPEKAGTAKSTDYIDALKQDASSGLTLSQIFAIYSGYVSADQIYQLYNSSSKYGPAKENISSLAKYGVTQPKSNNDEKVNALINSLSN